MPTGFKNSTDGSVGIAIDACRAARSGHVFLSVGKEGLSSIVETTVSYCTAIFFCSTFSRENERETRMCTSFFAEVPLVLIMAKNSFVRLVKN